MNKAIYYIASIILLSSLSGCDKFLEESSQNEVRPGSVIDLEELMTGEVYPVGTTFHNYLELLTDDVENYCNDNGQYPGIAQRWVSAFTWQKDMYEQLAVSGAVNANGSRIDTYEHYYNRIKGCNVVLDMLDKVKGEDSAKANVEGQALAMRAWFYFMLVNLYAQPYNAPGVDINASPGVPLITTSAVKDLYPIRASVADVYAQIEADLLKALPLLEQHGQQNRKFKATDMFVYTLLSRMYLYMEEWDKAIEYATKGLQKNPNLCNLADYVTETGTGTFTDGLYGINSPEAIWWGYGLLNQEYEAYDWGMFMYNLRVYGVSTGLRNLYETSGNADNRMDMRYTYYYFWKNLYYPFFQYSMVYGDKASRTTTLSSRTVKGMRVSELYLNRAEAYIHAGGRDSEALSDLNTLRRHRYDTHKEAYQSVSGISGDELLSFCRDERRRELSFEDHRWFDLRRYGMPEIKHTIQLDITEPAVEHILEQGSPRYVLPLPQYVHDRNYNLVPNP